MRFVMTLMSEKRYVWYSLEQYRLCAFAYSNIGSGCLFEVDWGSKSFIPINEDSSSDDGSHADGNHNETDEETASDVCSWCSEQSEELHEVFVSWKRTGKTKIWNQSQVLS